MFSFRNAKKCERNVGEKERGKGHAGHECILFSLPILNSILYPFFIYKSAGFFSMAMQQRKNLYMTLLGPIA